MGSSNNNNSSNSNNSNNSNIGYHQQPSSTYNSNASNNNAPPSYSGSQPANVLPPSYGGSSSGPRLVQDGVVDQQQTVMVVIKPHPLTVRQQRQLRIQVVQVVNMQMNCLNLLVWDLMIEIKTLRCYRNIKEIYKQLLLNCCRR